MRFKIKIILIIITIMMFTTITAETYSAHMYKTNVSAYANTYWVVDRSLDLNLPDCSCQLGYVITNPLSPRVNQTVTRQGFAECNIPFYKYDTDREYKVKINCAQGIREFTVYNTWTKTFALKSALARTLIAVKDAPANLLILTLMLLGVSVIAIVIVVFKKEVS